MSRLMESKKRCKGRPRKPFKSAKWSQVSATHTRCPPGVRAKRTPYRQYQPHKRSATRCKRRNAQMVRSAHRAIPTGKTLNCKGFQVHGKRGLERHLALTKLHRSPNWPGPKPWT
ncbi:Hypothetical predicted protein [Pelobates cultripes]|uniref:Uncharacterized protein n=1 Tax=Pelobates cultripes TaxID=61616 RepID=A0AAD1RUC3_PELCU|nr:Hypothetical predicted protein [Pelobates cultripes]